MTKDLGKVPSLYGGSLRYVICDYKSYSRLVTNPDLLCLMGQPSLNSISKTIGFQMIGSQSISNTKDSLPSFNRSPPHKNNSIFISRIKINLANLLKDKNLKSRSKFHWSQKNTICNQIHQCFVLKSVYSIIGS